MDSSTRSIFALRAAPSPIFGRLIGFVSVAALVLVWYLVTLGAPESRIVSPAILPTPIEVGHRLLSLVTGGADSEGGTLFLHIAASLRRVISGFALAFFVGVPLGIIAGCSGPVRAALAPHALFLRNIPLAALIPLTMVTFGIDEQQKTMFIFIAVAPFLMGDAMVAILRVPDKYIETAQTRGASTRQIITKVLIPLAMPGIYSSMRTLFGLAVGYIMLAELVNADLGLGHMLLVGQRRSDLPTIFAALVAIATLAYLVDRGLAFLQGKFFPYRPAED
jgi:ABC-type nitrate/sulfonate/bicarbonate transport system permease component